MSDVWEAERTEKQEALTQQLRELEEMGFVQAWVKDIQVGDIIVKTPDNFFSREMQMMVVERIFNKKSDYYDSDSDEFVENRVISWIGLCEDGVTREESFGHSHAMHIYRS